MSISDRIVGFSLFISFIHLPSAPLLFQFVISQALLSLLGWKNSHILPEKCNFFFVMGMKLDLSTVGKKIDSVSLLKIFIDKQFFSYFVLIFFRFFF